ncbi:hypothetical protein WJX73_007226 [Symbiochloris irregularis]|uniref:TPPC8 first Ig-like domain-containing protein n=1 Tax=Symbiochloris irregularis TaxID=706552 RepID=A0AAW1P5Z5_9CHLO
MDLRNWILERVSPAVMVVSSPAADAICREKNGLTVVDLLRPHGSFHHLSVPVRTVGDTSYRIRELQLRFFHSQTMTQPSREVADEHLHQLLNTLAKEHVDNEPTSMVHLLRKGSLSYQTPWFERYRQEFFRMLAFAEHECYDHPVACLYVVHVDAEDIVAELQQLQAGGNVPPLMRQGLMEASILQHCLVLHDATSEGGDARAQEQLKTLAARSNCSCSLMKVHVGTSDRKANGEPGHAGLWRAHFQPRLPRASAGELPDRPEEPDQGLGAALSSTDLKTITQVLEDFTVRYLLPDLELRLRALNQQVLVSRKGLRNQLKSLWRGKSASSTSLANNSNNHTAPAPETPGRTGPTPTAAGGQAYSTGSMEFQMRMLADVAFLMQDYELAGTTLRLLAADFKSDRAWKHYAGAQEMLALASFMAGASMATVTAAFSEAFSAYTEVARAAREPAAMVRYATRTALMLAEYQRAHGQFPEAHSALLQGYRQEYEMGSSMRAALLLEQAALFQLHRTPALTHKFAFYIVLAGTEYQKSSLLRLRAHAYRQALPVYQGKEWNYIKEHLHDALGKQLREGGEPVAAARHFVALLPGAFNPEAWQAYFLQQLLDTVQEAAAKGKVPPLDLPVPEVDVSRVLVRHDDHICHADSAALSQPLDQWRLLEGPLGAGAEGTTSWLDEPSSKAAVRPPTIVADEPLTLTLNMSNPMKLPLRLSHLRLSCSHSLCRDEASLSQYVQADELEFTLDPSDAVQIGLSVRPLQPGMLTVDGLEWTLNDHVRGFRAFPARDPAPSRRTTGVRRGAAVRDRRILQSRTFNVIPAMPRLEVHMENAPPSLLQGQLFCCRLSLRNTGPTPLKSLRMATLHPDIHLAPLDPSHDDDPLGPLSQSSADTQPGAHSGASPPHQHSPLGQSRVVARSHTAKHGVHVQTWPSELAIEPGQALRWNLWLHPRSYEPLLALLSWCYEAAQSPSDGPRQRLLRMTARYDVQPALAVTPVLTPSAQDLHKHLLRLDLDNSQGATALDISEVACSTPGWSLTPIADRGHAGAAPSAIGGSTGRPGVQHQHLEMPAGTRRAAFFHLHPPTRSGGNVTSGVRWMEADAGPLAHFQARPSHPPTEARGTRRTSDTSTDGASPSPAPVPSPSRAAPPGSPFAAAQGPLWDSPNILVAWRSHAQPASTSGEALGAEVPQAVGAVHLLDCRLQEGQAPIRALAEGCGRVTHDFAAAGACSVPLRLHLRNCLPHPAGLSVEAGHMQPHTAPSEAGAWRCLSVPADGPVQASDSQAVGPPAALDHLWCGCACTRIPDLPSGHQTSITLQVAVFAPGLYKIADYGIGWTTTSQGAQQGSFPGPPFLLQVDAAVPS